jgi:putative transposase
VSAADLALMRRIDKLHLDGTSVCRRAHVDVPAQARGHSAGRRHVGTLMRKMGIEALYRKKDIASERTYQHRRVKRKRCSLAQIQSPGPWDARHP